MYGQLLVQTSSAIAARQRVSVAARARVDAAVSVASSAARILAGDGPAAGVAARMNCPVVLSRGIGPAGEVQRKRRAEVCETEQRSATKTYRRPADQKLSFINHSKCIARICLLFSSRIESLPYCLIGSRYFETHSLLHAFWVAQLSYGGWI